MNLREWKRFAKYLKIVTKYRGEKVTVIRQYYWRDLWHNSEITLREIGEITGGQTSGNITNGLKSLRVKESINCKFTAEQKQIYNEKKERFLNKLEKEKFGKTEIKK